MVKSFLIKRATTSSRLNRRLRTKHLPLCRRFARAIRQLVPASSVKGTIQIAIVATFVVDTGVVVEAGPAEVCTRTAVEEALVDTMKDRIVTTSRVPDKLAQADSLKNRSMTIVNNLVVTETTVTVVFAMTGKTTAARMNNMAVEAHTDSITTDRRLIIAPTVIPLVTGLMEPAIKIQGEPAIKIEGPITVEVGTVMLDMRKIPDHRLLEEDTEVAGRKAMAQMEALAITGLEIKEVIVDHQIRIRASSNRATPTELVPMIARGRTTNISSRAMILVATIKDNTNVKLATKTWYHHLACLPRIHAVHNNSK